MGKSVRDSEGGAGMGMEWGKRGVTEGGIRVRLSDEGGWMDGNILLRYCIIIIILKMVLATVSPLFKYLRFYISYTPSTTILHALSIFSTRTPRIETAKQQIRGRIHHCTSVPPSTENLRTLSSSSSFFSS